jgi:hypothetical protein
MTRRCCHGAKPPTRRADNWTFRYVAAGDHQNEIVKRQIAYTNLVAKPRNNELSKPKQHVTSFFSEDTKVAALSTRQSQRIRVSEI